MVERRSLRATVLDRLSIKCIYRIVIAAVDCCVVLFDILCMIRSIETRSQGLDIVTGSSPKMSRMIL